MPVIIREVSTVLCTTVFGTVALILSIVLTRFTRLSKGSSITAALIVTFVLWITSIIVVVFLTLVKSAHLSGLAIFLAVLIALSIIVIPFSRVSMRSTILVLLVATVVLTIAITLLHAFSDAIEVRAQAIIAQPYIQQALDEQCEPNQYIADVRSFYFAYTPYDGSDVLFNGPFLRWTSGDGLPHCELNGKWVVELKDVVMSWDCSCP